MFDAIELERRGIPTVTIVQDRFEAAARLHARAQGFPSLPLLIEPTPEGGNIGQHSDKVADETLPYVVRALTGEVDTGRGDEL